MGFGVRTVYFSVAVISVSFLLTEPAAAAFAARVPSNIGVLLLGVAGLIVGLRSARTRRAAAEDDSAA